MTFPDPPQWLRTPLLVLAVLWAALLGIATIWPLFTHKTAPEWLAEKGWPRLTFLAGGWPYWSVSVAIILMIGFLIYSGSRSPIRRNINELGPEITRWAHAFGHSVGPLQPENDENFFSLVITLKNDVKINVRRTKALPNYLTTFVNFVPQEQEAFGKLAPAELDRLVIVLKFELSKVQMDYRFTPPLKSIHLIRLVPITPSIDADVLLQTTRELDAAARLVAATILLNIEQSNKK
jgi:hypothetical protein